ncbi:MAG: family transposase [Bradyrhizobium sp.]|nr:family transposase [Bradyrhizobium sp.]
MAEFESLFDLLRAIPDEQTAIEYFTAIRWRNGAFCPLCGSTKIYHFSDKRTHKCGDCRKRFSIKVGTIFQDTKVAIQKWLMAIWVLTSHKKGIASTTLARDIDVTQKTAWFMLHRLRQAALSESFNAPLHCDTEIDETYVGGKAHNRLRGDPKRQPRTDGKTAVIVALKRGCEVAARVMAITDAATLNGFVHAHFSLNATLVSTGEHGGHRHLERTFPHQVVRYGAGEYVSGDRRKNGIEDFWLRLKRQIIGVYRVVSSKHLSHYVAEASCRFEQPDAQDAVRLNMSLAAADFEPLPYKALVA